MSMYYDPELKYIARRLRKNSSYSQKRLWHHLRKKQILGYRFNRQKPIEHFIVDFYCHKLKLIIEVYRSGQENSREPNTKRSRYLRSMGCCILRFQDVEIQKDLEFVLMEIKKWIIFNRDDRLSAP